MKNYKNLSIALFLVLSLFISACNKDDVKLNNRNINKYLPGQWKVVSLNGEPYDEEDEFILDFDDNGDFSTIYEYDNGTTVTYGGGSWSFDDDNDKLTITNEYTYDNVTYSYSFDFNIIQLGEDNLEMRDEDNDLWVLNKR